MAPPCCWSCSPPLDRSCSVNSTCCSFRASAAMGLATLGLALAWGYVGILSFGHAAFFGLGAYAYAIAAINFGDSTLAILLAVPLPAAFALLLGHFLFFGRVGDVYLAVITLCVTLILFSFMNSTADPWYRIGAATLGGFNGIDAVPPLNWPGKHDASLLPADMFRLCFVALAVTYYLIGRLLRSDAGRILIAIRENELRSELVGYDVPTLLQAVRVRRQRGRRRTWGVPVYCQQRLCGPHGFRHQSSLPNSCFGSSPAVWAPWRGRLSPVLPFNIFRRSLAPTRS